MIKKVERILVSPIERFIKLESFSGILLFVGTIAALILANSVFSDAYFDFWNNKIGLETTTFHFSKPIILWVNDGLMAIFFFLIGLEIKREILVGELNSMRKASLPIFAAIGGIVIPVSLYFILNQNPETLKGWGIPMATDIAFTLAILKLLGNRVPMGLKIFLTAFAIVDDLGAVLTIAIFYSEEIKWTLIGFAIGLFALLIIFNLLKLYSKYVFFVISVIIWVLFLKSGIHPTIAGVLVAFTIPIQRKIGTNEYFKEINQISSAFLDSCDKKQSDDKKLLSGKQISYLNDLAEWSDKVQSPLQILEHRLHHWIAYIILPVFALANAGVALNSSVEFDTAMILNITISLIIGKSIGIVLFSFLSVKLRLADLPNGVNWRQIIGVSFLAGLGFTMSIFITNLAFVEQHYIDSAKLGIILASLIAGLIGYLILRIGSKKKVD